MAGTLLEMFSVSLMMVFAQNLVFSGVYGLSTLLEVLERPQKLRVFCVIVTGFSTASAILGTVLSRLFPETEYPTILYGLVCALCIAVLYTIVYLVLLRMKKTASCKILSMAAFNSAVLIIPMASRHLLLDPAFGISFGLFCGLGFSLAAAVVRYGFSSLYISHVPRSFRGLPIKLLYIAILSMVILGFSGQHFALK